MTDRAFSSNSSLKLLAGAALAGGLTLGLLIGIGLTWLALPDRGDVAGNGRYLAGNATPDLPQDLARSLSDANPTTPAPTIDLQTAIRLADAASAPLDAESPPGLGPATVLPAWMQPVTESYASRTQTFAVQTSVSTPAMPAPRVAPDRIDAGPVSMATRGVAPLPAWSDLSDDTRQSDSVGQTVPTDPPAVRPTTASADSSGRGPLPAWMQPSSPPREQAAADASIVPPARGEGDRTLSLASQRAASSGLDAADLIGVPELAEDTVAILDLPDLAGPTAGANGLIPPIDKDSLEILVVSEIDELTSLFDQADFSYQAVRDADLAVPRLLVASFPEGIEDVRQIELRKSLFFNTLLPLVLQVNEAIAVERARLMEIDLRLSQDLDLTAQERAWLADIAERYEAEPGDLDTLLARVDMVPPSMALAQGAVESGWGTSAMARQGNALFGQITTADSHLVDGDGVRFAAFDTLYDSVEAYVRNLNTHPAYRDFRAQRAAMRRAGDGPDGYVLMGTLTAYSELGGEYIAYVRRLMRANGLQAMDDARLAPPFTLEASL